MHRVAAVVVTLLFGCAGAQPEMKAPPPPSGVVVPGSVTQEVRVARDCYRIARTGSTAQFVLESVSYPPDVDGDARIAVSGGRHGGFRETVRVPVGSELKFRVPVPAERSYFEVHLSVDTQAGGQVGGFVNRECAEPDKAAAPSTR